MKLDSSAEELLAFLYAKIIKNCETTPYLRQYKSSYNYAWTANTLLLHKLEKTLHILHAQKWETMLLGASVLVINNSYSKVAMRPLHTITLLLRKNKHQRIICFDQKSILHESAPPEYVKQFWDKKETMYLAETTTSIPCATHNFFYTLLFAANAASLLWVLDCSMFLKNAAIDWSALQDVSKRTNTVQGCTNQLKVLQQYVSLPTSHLTQTVPLQEVCLSFMQRSPLRTILRLQQGLQQFLFTKQVFALIDSV